MSAVLDDQALLAALSRLECALHRLVLRTDAAALRALLHEDFLEFGRSGRVYRLADIVAQLGAETVPVEVRATQFELKRLAPDCALLSYRAAHVGANGALCRHTLRASIWQAGPAGWQMRFHQGTPTEVSP